MPDQKSSRNERTFLRANRVLSTIFIQIIRDFLGVGGVGEIYMYICISVMFDIGMYLVRQDVLGMVIV